MSVNRVHPKGKVVGRSRARTLIFLAFYSFSLVLVHWISSQPQCQYGDAHDNDLPVGDYEVSSSEQREQDKTNEEAVIEKPKQFNEYLQLYREMGLPIQDWQMFKSFAQSDKDLEEDEFETFADSIVARGKINKKLKSIGRSPEDHGSKNLTLEGKQKIYLAAVACGDRKDQALNMIKSAILFSQDVHLHLVVFSDNVTIIQVAAKVLELRWTAQALGWDFTYELHLDWFPADGAWKAMWAPCSTQRLFFPSLLPHIDSLIYLDSDTLVISNLTKLWNHFKNNMGSSKMAAMAPNSESTAPGYYEKYSKIPFYGDRGLNAGVMLMNLTQMREFGLEEKSLKIYSIYKKNITLADQDILNTLFHDYPDKLHVLNCSYNFYWVHCNHPWYNCYDKQGNSICFCRAVHDDGMQIVHGNMGDFSRDGFLADLSKEFEKVDLILTDHLVFFSSLQHIFKKRKRPCGPLTVELLYNNAITYLENLN